MGTHTYIYTHTAVYVHGKTCTSINICICVCVYIYIYIYIYIIRVLVDTKSLCGNVSNQVQYNMESAQYLGESYYIIIIINKYILDIYI